MLWQLIASETLRGASWPLLLNNQCEPQNHKNQLLTVTSYQCG